MMGSVRCFRRGVETDSHSVTSLLSLLVTPLHREHTQRTTNNSHCFGKSDAPPNPKHSTIVRPHCRNECAIRPLLYICANGCTDGADLCEHTDNIQYL